MDINKISLIGLGKLGLPLLSTFANNGQKIIGVDVDTNKINILKNNELPFYETNLKEYLIGGKNNIEYVNDFKKITDDTNVAIILVNTPSNESGEFSNRYVYDALINICKNLKNSNNKDFLFIISSTVMPGSHKEIIKLIESNSERKLNDGFGVVYIPDLVALGTVIKDFENPDLIIMGESNKKYGEIAEKVYSKILKNNPPIVRMSLVEAEITKVSLNAYITMKISFANFIGNIAEKFNANPNNITKALGYDKRISPHYIKSGLSFGGTCFPRDTWAFIQMSENVGLDAIHIKSTQVINENQNINLYDKIKGFKNKKIGIYGLSFKPNTYVTTESPGNILYERLLNEKYDVTYYDELIMSKYTDNFDKFIEDCDVLVITHETNKFSNIELKNKTIINPWKVKVCTDII
jgi:UDPglucose 6-dehydrogenase